MSTLQIKYATKDVVGFVVNNELFYLKFGPNIPQLFDESLSPLIVPNFDSWIQSKTQQRYSYQSLHDMAIAFYAGLSAAYNTDDLYGVCDLSAMAAIAEITKDGAIYEYSLVYWIETLGSDKMELYIKRVRDNFDKIRHKIGDNKLYNELCRMFKTCKRHQPHNAEVCENLIKRLGRIPMNPTYPNTDDTDQQVLLSARETVKKSLGTRYKGVQDSIVEIVDGIQSGRLPRTERVRSST